MQTCTLSGYITSGTCLEACCIERPSGQIQLPNLYKEILACLLVVCSVYEIVQAPYLTALFLTGTTKEVTKTTPRVSATDVAKKSVDSSEYSIYISSGYDITGWQTQLVTQMLTRQSKRKFSCKLLTRVEGNFRANCSP